MEAFVSSRMPGEAQAAHQFKRAKQPILKDLTDLAAFTVSLPLCVRSGLDLPTTLLSCRC
jgi:hypothetical protein